MSLIEKKKKGFMDVIKFINNPNEKFMDISGGAGTGKTYFISQIADNILKHKAPGCTLHTVAITATTNKAAAVISDAMPHRAGQIATIYSFMNLRVSENFQTGAVSSHRKPLSRSKPCCANRAAANPSATTCAASSAWTAYAPACCAS